MSSEQKASGDKTYFYVIDGSFRTIVPEGHPEGFPRKWETKDGKSGVKIEREVQALFGTIESIEFRDGDYGKQLYIFLDKNEEGKTPVMQFSVDSRYGDDLLHKLPHLQKDVEYRFMPFAFTPQGEEKEKRGVSIATRDSEGNFTEKVWDYFTSVSKSDGRNVYTQLHGFPAPTEEDKSDWPFYFKKASKFMIKYAEEHVLPRFPVAARPAAAAPSSVDYPHDNINPDDIPF